MNHSIVFTENELLILNKIAISPIPISRYELSDKGRDKKIRLEINTATISKTCKKLVATGVLEDIVRTNKKNAPKKVLKFTLYGFCAFITQSELFVYGPLRLPVGVDIKLTAREYSSTDKQIKILENWSHLHESIDWIYSIFLKTPNKQKGSKMLVLHQFNESCKSIIENTTPIEILGFPECLKRNPTIPEIIKHVDTHLDVVVFDNLFKYYIIMNDIDNFFIPLNDALDIIKKSETGRTKIKGYLQQKFLECEEFKKIDKLL